MPMTQNVQTHRMQALDVFYSPDADNQSIAIDPGGSKVIPTGLRFGVPHGYMLEVKNRSSVAAKRSLIVGACVVDSGYDGEVFVNLHNVGSRHPICSHRGQDCTTSNDSSSAF